MTRILKRLVLGEQSQSGRNFAKGVLWHKRPKTSRPLLVSLGVAIKRFSIALDSHILILSVQFGVV